MLWILQSTFQFFRLQCSFLRWVGFSVVQIREFCELINPERWKHASSVKKVQFKILIPYRLMNRLNHSHYRIRFSQSVTCSSWTTVNLKGCNWSSCLTALCAVLREILVSRADFRNDFVGLRNIMSDMSSTFCSVKMVGLPLLGASWTDPVSCNFLINSRTVSVCGQLELGKRSRNLSFTFCVYLSPARKTCSTTKILSSTLTISAIVRTPFKKRTEECDRDIPCNQYPVLPYSPCQGHQEALPTEILSLQCNHFSLALEGVCICTVLLER